MFKFQNSWKIRAAKKCDLYLKKLIIAGLRSYKDVFIEWKPLALNWYKNSANIVSGVYTDYSCYSTTLGPIKAAWEGFLEDRLAIVVDRRFFSKWRNIQVIPVNALSFIGTTKNTWVIPSTVKLEHLNLLNFLQIEGDFFIRADFGITRALVEA